MSNLSLVIGVAGITLLTGQSIWYSELRQVIIGFAAAGITCGVGQLWGITITG
jgi:vacuolar iron transporter family protein